MACRLPFSVCPFPNPFNIELYYDSLLQRLYAKQQNLLYWKASNDLGSHWGENLAPIPFSNFGRRHAQKDLEK